ncbi:endo-1,3;1,4-beta-D-glucanase isoform X1 [Morus notabilis]|uniref:endo-1,3;1,4-beta-D-glucanase isoform X1 n=1 Tax=Morus notabilis TaxID=981085 RepID=UPI000CED28D8|nr:endo-1,3;1,4-beta-D-glucanase isoform X1 [Morus notabilis]
MATAKTITFVSFILFISLALHAFAEQSALGPHCGSNPPTLNASSGAGHVEKLGGLDSYVTGFPISKHAVILVSDVYGYQAPNLRKLADKIAAAGFFVAVPDFFHGEPYDPNNTSRPKDAWLNDHRPEKGFEEAKPLIKDLKSKGFSAIGVAGFCWGAKVVIELAKFTNFIQAAALLHPSFVIVDDIKEVKVSTAILGAEHDNLSPPPLVKQFEKVLSAKPEINTFVKIYPGVAHGWTVRYDVKDEAASKRAEEAHKDLLEFFTKHVK